MTATNGLLLRKIRPAPTSVPRRRDGDVTTPYFAGMRNPDRNPLHSYCPILFEHYTPHSELGIALRKGDARLRLKEMDAAEPTVRSQEAINLMVRDRLIRMQAEHELDLQYLLQFGVFAAERETFRQILEEVSRHGGLSLRQAADLAHAKRLAENGAQPLV